MLAYPFMVNAFEAGTVVAVVAGVVGWFMVLRRQTFAGHTLALVGFPGAAGATLLGLSAQLGFYAFGIGGALVIAALPDRRGGGFHEETTVVATFQAVALAAGFLFVSLHHGNAVGVNALLFGTFFGISAAQVASLALLGALALAVTAAIARPLLFASVDPAVAAARGVPTGLVATVALVVLGVAAAATSQITGALLVFALLVLPAATAQRMTARPAVGAALAAAIGVAVTWAGLTLAYETSWPLGFTVTTVAFALYVLAAWRC